MEVPPSWYVLAVALLAASAIISKLFNAYQTRKSTPPGPGPWPIIVNLILIGLPPHQSLHNLSRKDGQLCSLNTSGPRPWPIIVNLNLIGPLPHQSLHNLSRKNGQLRSLSSVQMVKTCLGRC
ncbi:hypothetical protein RJ639_026771 [Escallonia herrerae]|uniref:Cytochrome P450 n=1 Tax=Escallonia herrerae TaxID=1293975 RepID=A0AA89BQJ3_9ASTE|nr:hypothetical protein RJ639_026771 [Escallonia herrerae]